MKEHDHPKSTFLSRFYVPPTCFLIKTSENSLIFVFVEASKTVIYLAWELQFQKLFWVGHLINVSLKSKYKSSISNIWDICMPEYNWMNWCFYIHRQLPQFQVTSNDIIYIFIIAILGGTQNLFFSFFLKIEARLFIIKFCTEQNKILHFHKTIWIIYTKGLRVISY